jgi:hypothetical protein
MAVDINITGQFKVNGVPITSGGVTSVTGTAPVVSSGGATPAISMAAATTSVNGYLTSTDWTTFNNKQAALVSGTNIKTINSTSLLGSGNLVVSATPSGLANQIQFSDGTAFSSSTEFIYTASGFGNLGVGLNAPTARVHIKGRGTFGTTFGLLVQNSSSLPSLQCADNLSVYSHGKGGVTTNTAFGLNALIAPSGTVTGTQNTAIGVQACYFNSTGQLNTGVGYGALGQNFTGSNNVAIGAGAIANGSGSNNVAIGVSTVCTGSSNTIIGESASGATFSASVVLGRGATATASNQFVVGSTSYNAGTVAAEVNASANVWNVVINGVARKILLA